MIYTASKTKHADKWKRLRAAGIPINSTWIDEAGEGETFDFADLWKRCLQEASECEVLVLYRERDEVLKGAYVEVGCALSHGNKVVAVGFQSDCPTFLRHPLVTHRSTLEAGMDTALSYCSKESVFVGMAMAAGPCPVCDSGGPCGCGGQPR